MLFFIPHSWLFELHNQHKKSWLTMNSYYINILSPCVFIFKSENDKFSCQMSTKEKFTPLSMHSTVNPLFFFISRQYNWFSHYLIFSYFKIEWLSPLSMGNQDKTKTFMWCKKYLSISHFYDLWCREIFKLNNDLSMWIMLHMWNFFLILLSPNLSWVINVHLWNGKWEVRDVERSCKIKFLAVINLQWNWNIFFVIHESLL